MQFTMSNQQFLNTINLEQNKFKSVRKLILDSKIDQAALQCASIIFSKPFKQAVNENDVEKIAKHINKHYPDAIIGLKRSTKGYEKQTGHVNMRCHTINNYARLLHLSGSKSYIKKIKHEIQFMASIIPHLPDDEIANMYIWHAGDEQFDHHHFNYALYELCNALPLIRTQIHADDQLQLLKNILCMAEYCYRSTSDDVVFNHPMGNITGVCIAGCNFPDFKDAQTWVQWSHDKLLKDCVYYPTFTEDGYSREGFSYQEVNAKHLVRAWTAMKYSGFKINPKVTALCEKTCTFYIPILQNNGHYPLIGDCGTLKLSAINIWHQASALFKNPTLKFMNPVEPNDGCVERVAWDVGYKNLRWWEQQKRPSLKHKVQKPHDMRKTGFQIYGFGKGVDAHYGMLCSAIAHNHAHHDVGSINISAFGKSLISDPGKGTYTQPLYRKECFETIHNLSCLIRRNPLGPRVDDMSYSKTIYVQHKKKYQASAMLHTLYENHTYKRSLIGIPLPTQTAGNPDVIWFVYDHITRDKPWPKNSTDPLELVDTYFHFNAPETDLGIDKDTLTCWSKHSAQKQYLHKFSREDINLNGPSTRVDMQECLKGLHMKPSNGNLQITAIIPHKKGTRTDLRQEETYTLEYRERVRRPSINFQYRGQLPFRSLFVLIPFNSVRQSPIAQVTGTFSNANTVAVNIRHKNNDYHFVGKNLVSAKPQISLI